MNDNEVIKAQLITMAKDPGSVPGMDPIITVYSGALKGAIHSLTERIGEYEWETKVALLLVEGISDSFQLLEEVSVEVSEQDQEDEYGEEDAIENENAIKAIERKEWRIQARRRIALLRQKGNLKAKRPRGRPRKGMEGPKDENYVGKRVKQRK